MQWRARPRLLTLSRGVHSLPDAGSCSCSINAYPVHLMCTLDERADVDTVHVDGRRRRSDGVWTLYQQLHFTPPLALTADPFYPNSANLLKKVILTLPVPRNGTEVQFRHLLRLPRMVQLEKVWCSL